MNGKIYFNDLKQLAEFPAAFTGRSTAVFEVTQDNNGRWVLEFGGGY
jgi:hypothetical protein